MTSTTLVLFTESYPHDQAKERNFIADELDVLAARFERVVVVPTVVGGARHPTPDGVDVDESLAALLATSSRVQVVRAALSRAWLLEDLLHRRESRTPAGLKRLLLFAGQAVLVARWTRDLLSARRIDASSCVLYGYWWTSAIVGAALAETGAKVVARTHGHDVYEERHVPAYLPLREQSLRLFDGLYPASPRATEYVRERYRAQPRELCTMSLSIRDPNIVNRASEDGVVRIASCSFVVAVKRLDRIVDALRLAARSRPSAVFEWHHFGNGPLPDDLRARVDALPSNARVVMHAYSSQDALYADYARQPIDLFVNTSESEGGTPVALMEAAACTIPLAAAHVGGNGEIVTPENGRLLAPDAVVEELAGLLVELAVEPKRDAWRAASRAIWRARFDAADQVSRLPERLLSLVSR